MSMAMLGWMQGAGALLQVLGGIQSAKAATQYGKAQQAAAELQAWHAEEQAETVVAVSQRQAEEQLRQGRMQASRMLALAAASGGGMSDPTIVRLIAGAETEASYRASVALYEGESKARQLKLDAAIGRVSGANAALEGATVGTGRILATAGAAVRGGMSLYEKYGRKGPSGSGDSNLIEPGSDPQFDH